MTARPKDFLPYGRHLIEEDDIAAVTRVLKGEWLTTGPTVKAFEIAFAERAGARFAVACSSGTAGLHLAALALGLGEGDAVVVPTITFLATANAARFVGAEVVFSDVDPGTGLMDRAALRQALDRTPAGTVKAVFPVHVNGQCVDMEMVAAEGKENGFRVVEDACHAIGTTYRTREGATLPVGSCRHSDMAVFSLHPVKTLAMGEGGMVTTNDEALYRRLLRYRNHGLVRDPDAFENREQGFDKEGEPNPWYYEMHELGFNYRASDINCALGLSQLGKLERFVARRRALAERYDVLLAPLAPLVRPIERVQGCNPAWHLYVTLIDFTAAGVTRAEVMTRLREQGVGTQVHFIPVHGQPYYQNRYGYLVLPGAQAYHDRALALPLFPYMTAEDPGRVVSALTTILMAGE